MTARETNAELRAKLAATQARVESLQEHLTTAARQAGETNSEIRALRARLLNAGLVQVGELLDVEYHEKDGSSWATITVADADIIDTLKKRQTNDRQAESLRSASRFSSPGQLFSFAELGLPPVLGHDYYVRHPDGRVSFPAAKVARG
jgi:chromosome segregation ATPase